MTKKKSEEKSADMLERAHESVFGFWELCKLLFADTDETPYRMNELKESSKFYKEAVEMSKELGIDWEKMSDADSNRVMINMLADRYASIGETCARKCKIEISVVLKDGSSKVAITEEPQDA
ncbi:MAG: hypothetical protein MR717_09235 [Prevotella sp.]|nr:hypothetical protein [Prevotella sp.]